MSVKYHSMENIQGGVPNDVAAGKIMLDGVEVWRAVAAVDSAKSPFRMDGTYRTWAITGGEVFAAFKDSVRAPTAPTQITSPRHGDTIRPGDGIVIEWSPSARNGDSMSVSVIAGSPGASVEETPPDIGRFHFTVPRARRINPGRNTIVVQRMNTRRGRVEGKRYELSVVSSETIEVVVMK